MCRRKELRLSFQGVESGMAVWLNGSYVGYSEDSFTPSEFAVTPYVKAGENKLAVQVYKWTSSSWCEDQDFFRFSGIYRSVYLYAVLSVHMEDIRIKTLFTGQDFTKAELEVRTKVSGRGSIRYTLKDGEKTVFERESRFGGETAFSPQLSKDECRGAENGQEENIRDREPQIETFREEIREPKLWSAEQPYLYRLECEVIGENGGIEEYTEQMVGLRKFEMKDNRMLLNGRRIVFKGVNRHEFSAVSGS